jgi:hypothetical protein
VQGQTIAPSLVWWVSVQPQLVNENAIGPKANPFKELYEKQFGNGAESPQKEQREGQRSR